MTLSRLKASGWKGLSFEEEPLPPKLLLSGPNGSGKTARLEAIRYALSLPKDKAGLAPYMSGPLCSIAVGTGSELVTRTCERIEKGDQVSYRMASFFDPTMGEKTEAAVNARVAATFGIDAFLLDLEGWLGQSAPERRRQLMAICQPFANAVKPEEVCHLLEESLPGNEEADQILAACPDPRIRKEIAPLDWLRMVEESAKARVASLERTKDGAEARLRTMRDNPLGLANSGKPPAQLREEIAELDGKIEEAGKVQVTAVMRKRRLDAIGQEREGCLKRLPEELRSTTPGEELASSYAAYAARGEALAVKASEDARKADAARGKAWAATVAIGKTFGEASGRVNALMELAEAWKGGTCPVCGAQGVSGDAFAAGLLSAREAEEKAKEAKLEANGALQTAEMANRKARLDSESAQTTVRQAQWLRSVVARLLDLETETATETEDAGHLPEPPAEDLVNGWRAKRHEIKTELDEMVRAEERRKLTVDAGKEADDAEGSRKKAAAVAKAAGPLGVGGEVLLRMVRPVIDAMADAAPSHLPCGIRLFDERGGPDAMLVLDRGSGPVPYQAMSGGERAIALAAFAAALSKARPGKKAVLLVEAGEIDTENLSALCAALGKLGTANVVIATHHEVDEPMDGFEVRKLGAYAERGAE